MDSKVICAEALDTASRRLDVSNFTKPELRKLVAVAAAIAARGQAELEARPCTFPARLAPLVTQWLRLADVGAALSCSSQWRGTSEWAFQLVAARIGLVREPGISWRDNVKHRLHWTGVLTGVEWTGGATCTAYSGDTYFVGSGVQFPSRGTRDIKWRVRMTRGDSKTTTDACRFVLLDSTRSQILLSYHWNSDGELYEDDQFATPWMREYRLHADDDLDYADIWGDDATLQISVESTLVSLGHNAGTLHIVVTLDLVETDGSLSRLANLIDYISYRIYPDEFNDFARRCERPQTPENLCVVPFVRIFEDSTATLSRVPTGPDAARSDDEQQ